MVLEKIITSARKYAMNISNNISKHIQHKILIRDFWNTNRTNLSTISRKKTDGVKMHIRTIKLNFFLKVILSSE